MKNQIVITVVLSILGLLNSSNAFSGESKYYDVVETGECSTIVAGISNKKRMIQNAKSKAESFCLNLGGVASGGSDFIADTEGPKPYFCRVKGTIECNNKTTNPAASIPSAKCEVVSLQHDLGYKGGNKHQYCMKKQYSGGAINNSCFRGECPRITRYYYCLANNGGNSCCKHLSPSDEGKLHVCGY